MTHSFVEEGYRPRLLPDCPARRSSRAQCNRCTWRAEVYTFETLRIPWHQVRVTASWDLIRIDLCGRPDVRFIREHCTESPPLLLRTARGCDRDWDDSPYARLSLCVSSRDDQDRRRTNARRSNGTLSFGGKGAIVLFCSLVVQRGEDDVLRRQGPDRQSALPTGQGTELPVRRVRVLPRNRAARTRGSDPLRRRGGRMCRGPRSLVFRSDPIGDRVAGPLLHSAALDS
jgi:hypothetical protein